MSAATPSTRTRLPSAQRREQILRAAADLFWRRGYNGVGIDDIGAEIGISGPALYRHIEGKEQLVASISIGLLHDLIDVCTAALASNDDPADQVDALVRAVAPLCLERTPDVIVGIRYLKGISSDAAAEVNELWPSVAALWIPALAATHKHIAPTDGRLMIYATTGALSGIWRHTHSSSDSRTTALAVDTVGRILAAQLPPSTGSSDTAETGAGWTRSSRREQILEAAVALFREHGYSGVSMAEIADAVGLTASASYRHFKNKEDILATAINRAGERITSSLDEALSGARSAADALDRLIAGYVGVAVGHRDVTALAGTEMRYLPEEQRARGRERSQLFDNEWALCLAETRPELSPAERHVLIWAVRGFIGETCRSMSLSKRPAFAAELRTIAHAILDPA